MTTVRSDQHPEPAEHERDGQRPEDVVAAGPRRERGAVGTEMAIVVAIVVAIALALGVVMRNSAEAHQECIPQTPGAAIPAGC